MASQQIYFEEIHSDDEGPEAYHDGEAVEQLAPCELPVHTLTADMVAAHLSQEDEKKKDESAAAAAANSAAAADAETLRLQGNAAFGNKNFEEAVRLYTDALELSATNGLIYGNRSAALLQLGKAQQAAQDARAMVKLLPENPKAHFRLGNALSKCDQPVEAAKALLRALKLDPSSAAIADALRKEMARPAVKKAKDKALLRSCQQALGTSERGCGEGAAADAASGAAARLVWRECAATGGKAPPKRGGATLSAAGGRLWLVGGATRTGDLYDDVWEYAPSDGGESGGGGSWRKHEAGALSGRSGHAAATVPTGGAGGDGFADESVVVFGGQDCNSSALHGDLRWLSIPRDAAADGSAKWGDGGGVKVSGAPPEARNGHTLTRDASGDALYVFGGANGEGHLHDVHALRLSYAAPLEGCGGGGEGAAAKVLHSATWEAPATSGPAPTAREMHCAAVTPLPRRRLLIHGGRSGEAILNDVCMLDLGTWVWSAAARTACARVGHALVPLGGGGGGGDARLVVFGGIDDKTDAMPFCNDTWHVVVGAESADEGCTMRRAAADEKPVQRFAHAAAALGTSIYVFGGSSPGQELNDLHQVQLPS